MSVGSTSIFVRGCSVENRLSGSRSGSSSGARTSATRRPRRRDGPDHARVRAERLRELVERAVVDLHPDDHAERRIRRLAPERQLALEEPRERAARERLDDVVLRLPRLDEEPPARREHAGELVQRLQRDLGRAEVRTREQLVEIGDDTRRRRRASRTPRRSSRRRPSAASARRVRSPSRSGRPARRSPSRSRVRRARDPSPRSDSAPPQYGHSSGAVAVAPHTRQRRFGRSNARPAPHTSHVGAQPQSVQRNRRTSPRRPTNTSASGPARDRRRARLRSAAASPAPCAGASSPGAPVNASAPSVVTPSARRDVERRRRAARDERAPFEPRALPRDVERVQPRRAFGAQRAVVRRRDDDEAEVAHRDEQRGASADDDVRARRPAPPPTRRRARPACPRRAARRCPGSLRRCARRRRRAGR